MYLTPIKNRCLLPLVLAATLATRADITNALVIPTGTTDATVVANGQTASSAGLFGAIEGVHQFGSTFYASVTMLTDFSGNRFAIQPVPAFGTYMDLGGFGMRGPVGGTLQVQDGKPGKGSAKNTAVTDPLIDNTIYGSTRINDASIDSGGAPGDSGGRVGVAAGPIGVMSAGNGTGTGNKTYFTKLTSVESWIDQYVDASPADTVWGITAAHVSIDVNDPVTLLDVKFTDVFNPSTQYNVVQTINYPTYTGSGTSVVDLNHPDVALVRLAVPEPTATSLLLVGLFWKAASRRPRRAAN